MKCLPIKYHCGFINRIGKILINDVRKARYKSKEAKEGKERQITRIPQAIP